MNSEMQKMSQLAEASSACIVSLPKRPTVTLRLTTAQVQICVFPERSKDIASVVQRLQAKLQKACKKLRAPAPSLSLLASSGGPVDLSGPVGTLGDCTLMLGGTPLPLRRNPPESLSLSVPGYPIEGRPIMPLASLQNASGANWRWLRGIEEEAGRWRWQSVGEHQSYTPTKADYGCILKVEITPTRENTAPGATMTAFTGTQSTLDLPHTHSPSTNTVSSSVRKQSTLGWHKRRQQLLQTELSAGVKVVSYNLLAEYNLKQEVKRGGDKFYGLFENRDIELAFEHRRQVLLEELLGYDADILLLQEVDRVVMFFEFLQPHLRRLGYSGHYSNKQHTSSPIGQAIFWRRSKYLLLSSHTADLTIPIQKPVSQQDEELFDLLQRDGALRFALSKTTKVSNIALLQPKDGMHGPPLCVCNNHFFGDPSAPHLRVLQAAIALQHCKAVCTAAAGSTILIGGDFNCGTEEGACEFLAGGALPSEHAA